MYFVLHTNKIYILHLACMPVRSCLYWLWMGDGAGRPERLRAVYGEAKFEMFLEDLSHRVAEVLPSLNLRGPNTRVSCFELSTLSISSNRLLGLNDPYS